MCFVNDNCSLFDRKRILANRKQLQNSAYTSDVDQDKERESKQSQDHTATPSSSLRRIVLGLVWLVLPLSATSAFGQEARIVPQDPPKRLGIYSSFVDLRFYASGPQANIVPGGGNNQLNFGERVERVEHGSAAWRAGLERGDVIVATYRPQWGGDARVPIRYRGHLRQTIRRSGDSLKLLVRNVRNGRLQKVTVRFRTGSGPRPMLRSTGS